MTAFPRLLPMQDVAFEPIPATAPKPRPLGIIVRVLAVAIAYYVGARVGFLFQSPSVPQSVLWLPNSILLAALCVSPLRSWPVLMLASFPAQLLVGWQTHGPIVTMALIFVTNCADAALGATIWRFVSPGEWRIEGLRPMLAFLVLCATIPTLLLSFADAGITVGMGWSHDYWLVFETRARANVLTNVIFVPTMLAVLSAGREALAAHWRGRSLEGVILFAGLLSSAAFAFSRPTESLSGAALVYLPLVFLLWSAVRFGVGVTGGALLALAYLTTWMAMHGIGHLAEHAPADVVPALQYQLLAIAVPMLCLCAVIQDREHASRALGASQRALHQSLAQIRNLAGRLLTATEVERTRIARELHDDVSQQLAALGIGLSALKRHLPNDSPVREEVTILQGQAMRAADDLRALSHELHPAALRHAGLVPALRELCAQYGRGDSMRAVLAAKPREISVPHDVALCVYRVTQEALRNAARHSGAHGALVTLQTTEEALELHIADDGRGFDESAARRRGGLGLTSIDERVRLVGGTVHVDTSPGHGTRISVRVPNGDPHGSAHAPARG
ncbi:MAG TPA: MASE1 domain-containing protein [Gemmatimonadaceae bacterium]|nr:MASE1 domain-containing protein [Gemmatimonadaceae bacterium]